MPYDILPISATNTSAAAAAAAADAVESATIAVPTVTLFFICPAKLRKREKWATIKLGFSKFQVWPNVSLSNVHSYM